MLKPAGLEASKLISIPSTRGSLSNPSGKRRGRPENRPAEPKLDKKPFKPAGLTFATRSYTVSPWGGPLAAQNRITDCCFSIDFIEKCFGGRGGGRAGRNRPDTPVPGRNCPDAPIPGRNRPDAPVPGRNCPDAPVPGRNRPDAPVPGRNGTVWTRPYQDGPLVQDGHVGTRR